MFHTRLSDFSYLPGPTIHFKRLSFYRSMLKNQVRTDACMLRVCAHVYVTYVCVCVCIHFLGGRMAVRNLQKDSFCRMPNLLVVNATILSIKATISKGPPPWIWGKRTCYSHSSYLLEPLIGCALMPLFGVYRLKPNKSKGPPLVFEKHNC